MNGLDEFVYGSEIECFLYNVLLYALNDSFSSIVDLSIELLAEVKSSQLASMSSLVRCKTEMIRPSGLSRVLLCAMEHRVRSIHIVFTVHKLTLDNEIWISVPQSL